MAKKTSYIRYTAEEHFAQVKAAEKKLETVTNDDARRKLYHGAYNSLNTLGEDNKALEIAKKFHREYPDHGFSLIHTSLTKLERHYEALGIAEKFVKRFPELDAARKALRTSLENLGGKPVSESVATEPPHQKETKTRIENGKNKGGEDRETPVKKLRARKNVISPEYVKINVEDFSRDK